MLRKYLPLPIRKTDLTRRIVKLDHFSSMPELKFNVQIGFKEKLSEILKYLNNALVIITFFPGS